MRAVLLGLLLAACSSYSISYTIEEDERLDVYTANGSGRFRVRTTQGPDHGRDGALSADGAWLAFVSVDRRPGSPPRLSLIDAEGERRSFVPLPEGTVSNPAFFPAGDRLVFAFAPKGERPHLYGCRRDGGELLRIGEDRRPALQPAVSPDGTLLAHVRLLSAGGREKPALFVMDSRSGGGERMLSRPGEEALGPSFSPDGKRIAFASRLPGESSHNVTLLKLADGSFERRTGYVAPEAAHFPVFSPDGTEIVFLLETPRGRRICWMPDRPGAVPEELVWHPGMRLERLSAAPRR